MSCGGAEGDLGNEERKCNSNLNWGQVRWLLDLSEFDLTFKHIPGKDLQ